MTFKCAHFADIHFRGLTRHEEYRDVFSKAFKELKKLGPDIIYIGGDIVHSKTQGISPELIHILTWWFSELASIAPVHLILGNHDGLILNKDRLDAITPIINAMNNENIVLFRDSGVYSTGIDGFNWCVFSCFDEEGWKSVKPKEDEINIALFHGPVNGSLTDEDWEINGDSVKVDFFNGFEFAFLGDIHKRQFLREGVAYPGSTIQQNYGESTDKGFLFWEINSKSDFSCEFIQLHNKRSFRTYDWQGTVIETIDSIPEEAVGSRFRIVHQGIPQVEFKQLQNELKEKFQAEEVVSKYEAPNRSSDSKIITNAGEISKQDLRSFSCQDSLMSHFLESQNLSESEREDVRALHKSTFQKCVRETKSSGRWRLRQLRFDNTFGYGDDNLVNFDSLSGITGIFGKNRSGKSSIPGTIVYGLFNSTDRGSLKNLHVVNDRKTYCRSTIDLSIGSKMYRVDRQTLKRTSRKGVVSAPTTLNLFELDESGNEIIDKSEEQRRETEKVLRGLVGTVEDFTLTSFASQGEMNAFIKEGATKRKSILTRFLDLNIFENMMRSAKEEINELRGEMKTAPDRDWDSVIQENQQSLTSLAAEMKDVEDELADAQRRKDKVKLQLAVDTQNKGYTIDEIKSHENLLSTLNDEKRTLANAIIDTCSKIEEISQRVQKVEIIQGQFPVEELRERLESQKNLEISLKDLEHQRELEKQKINSGKKLAKKMEPCDCFEHKPTCKYLKKSNKQNELLREQSERSASLTKAMGSTKRALNSLLKENLEEKLEKYQGILQQVQDLKMERSDFRLSLRELETKEESVTRQINETNEALREMKLHSLDPVKDAEIVKMRNELVTLEKRITSLDGERLYHAEQLSITKRNIITLKEEKEKYGGLRRRWETYNRFISAVDRHGIPSEIIALQLPLINLELQNILQGVVNFNLRLEVSQDGSIEVMLDYGDSSRIVECGSGMEKMISSLALRVALINVCTLPRSDMLIIDEGFGALDDKNVEACSRLLLSLKKYFSNIIIISHVDAVKDVVDNVIDIQKKGKDAKVQCI